MATQQRATEFSAYHESEDPRGPRVQESFLHYIQRRQAPVTVFLINGVKLQGIVPSFDNDVLILRRDGHAQLVYKHAISTIMPISPISLFGSDEGVGESM